MEKRDHELLPQWALVPGVDTRPQGVPQAVSDQEEYREILISGFVRAILSDLAKGKLVEEMQNISNIAYTHLSEDAKGKF